MSRKLSLKSLNDKQLQKISDDLQIEQKASKYAFNQTPSYVCLFEVEGDDLYIPFAYNYKRPLGLDSKPGDAGALIKFPRRNREEFSKRNPEFQGELREPQKEVRKEALEELNKTGSVIISCYCGFGKTITAINIACKIKMKVLILCHRIVLINQWRDSIIKFCPKATWQILSPGSKMKNVDFYIINAINVPKNPREYYRDVGCVVVDESHCIMADKLSQCMRYILPRYVIGLTATPYRMDGLDALLDMYFGTYKIERKLYRRHTVYKVDTGFKPIAKLAKNGKVDWSSIIESTCGNEDRNELIVRIISYFCDRVFLVLCKRVDQAKYLVKRLKEEGEDVTSLIGKNQIYEQKSRILVGTTQKAGVGFDHPRLNAMILASDVENYFQQYLGRVFRREDTEPIIFDLVDIHPILNKHFRTRNAVYLEHGGIIKNLNKENPAIFDRNIMMGRCEPD